MQKNLGKIKRTVEEYVVLTVADCCNTDSCCGSVCI